jgi:hypothetical protein
MQTHSRPTLWRLYTDTRFRKEFLFDKHTFYQKYDIPPDIIHFLEDTPIDELTFFADNLLQKRMHKVKAFLPLTFRLIGKDTQMLFFKFCDYHTSSGAEKHQDDAFHFTHYLLKRKDVSFHLKYNVYVKSVLLFEQQQLRNEGVALKPQFNFYDQGYLPPRTPFLKYKKRKRPPVQKFQGIEEWLRKGKMKKRHIRFKGAAVSDSDNYQTGDALLKK